MIGHRGVMLGCISPAFTSYCNRKDLCQKAASVHTVFSIIHCVPLGTMAAPLLVTAKALSITANSRKKRSEKLKYLSLPILGHFSLKVKCKVVK